MIRKHISLRHFSPLAWLACVMLALSACEPTAPSTERQQPAPQLVVGIMVDQMRYDYLYRYWDKYGDDGFKRLLREGFSFDNARFDYMPTFTGPGHASVYTGTTPSVHGIIGNWWYSRDKGRQIYVVRDDGTRTVGAEGRGGRMSPHRLLTTTLGDELRLHTNQRSRVIGLSLKDRSAVLPAGHTGEAYWLDNDSGRFVTSSYYREELPQWLQSFNARGLVDQYLAGEWRTLLPPDQYTESIADDNPYEVPFPGAERPTLPYDLAAIAEHYGRRLVAHTPFGDELLLELTLAALEHEQLGRNGVPDMLSVSFSAPDHVGHQFGPASVEVQDTYLRLDRQIARLLDYLDKHYGRDNVVVFLTSDHGVAHIPQYLQDLGIPAAELHAGDMEPELRSYVETRFGEDFIESFSFMNLQVFLDRERIDASEYSQREVQEALVGFLLGQKGVAGAVSGYALAYGEFSQGLRAKVQRGYHQRLSGDVVFWLQPNYMPHVHETVRTIHGAGYSYDTRAPMLWWGGGITAGRSTQPVFITDIAPTLAVMLNAPFPASTTGNPINHLIGAE
jgi:arylsulfatase A-like enzyme